MSYRKSTVDTSSYTEQDLAFYFKQRSAHKKSVMFSHNYRKTRSEYKLKLKIKKSNL